MERSSEYRVLGEAQLAAAAFLARNSGRTVDAYRHDRRAYFQWVADGGLGVLGSTWLVGRVHHLGGRPCFDRWMAERVRVRRLSDAEGRQLQQIVRRGGKSDRSKVKWRRAMVVLASAGGNDVATIARLVQTSPDRVREMR